MKLDEKDYMDYVVQLVAKYNGILQYAYDDEGSQMIMEVLDELTQHWGFETSNYSRIEMEEVPDDYVVTAQVLSDGQGIWVAEHSRTGHVIGTFRSYSGAIEGIKERIIEWEEYNRSVNENIEKMQTLIQRNSLTERYKDKVLLPKKREVELHPYLARLRACAEKH